MKPDYQAYKASLNDPVRDTKRELLRIALDATCLTRAEVCRRIGVAERTLYDWLKGTSDIPYPAYFAVTRLEKGLRDGC